MPQPKATIACMTFQEQATSIRHCSADAASALWLILIMMSGTTAESGGVIVCATVQEISEPRTLLDLMRERMDGGDARRARWKGIKERLRLRGLGFCGALWAAFTVQNDVVNEPQSAPLVDAPVTSMQHAPARTDVDSTPAAADVNVPVSSDPHAPTGSVVDYGIAARDEAVEALAVTSEPHAPSQSIIHAIASRDNVVIDAVEISSEPHAQAQRVVTDSECTSPVAPSMNLAAALEAEREFRTTNENVYVGPARGGVAACGEVVLKVTLMRLLTMDGGDEERERRGGVGIDCVCCVCMVRKKGAAYIPCGHTFCRVCSRELWLIRGTCPLCSRSILDILNIF
ncbi:hypothetical protein Droror1_Dr00020584 [Drosera rotundifolia]